jgi:ABC-type branched-subunit amino acid transport system permease subunit
MPTTHRVAAGIALALAILAPWLPGFPPFWVTLLSYIGLSGLVALGLVVLVGVAGLTSFGQAMFVGFGAYTTAILTTRYGITSLSRPSPGTFPSSISSATSTSFTATTASAASRPFGSSASTWAIPATSISWCSRPWCWPSC